MAEIVIWKPGDALPPLEILDWVTDDLAVGSLDQAEAADVLDIEGVKAIVSIGEYAAKTELFHRHFPDIRDDDTFMRLTDREIQEVLAAIREALSRGKVLLHCAAGVSRSPGFAALHIAIADDISFSEALARVKERRTKASPELHVLARLGEYRRTHPSFMNLV